MILAIFQINGISFWVSDLVKIFVTTYLATRPRYFKCLLRISSRPRVPKFFINFKIFALLDSKTGGTVYFLVLGYESICQSSCYIDLIEPKLC